MIIKDLAILFYGSKSRNEIRRQYSLNGKCEQVTEVDMDTIKLDHSNIKLPNAANIL